MKRIAVICENTNNFIRAVQIKKLMFGRDKVDLYIVMHEFVLVHKSIIENLRQSGLFNEVICVKKEDLYPISRIQMLKIFLVQNGLKRALRKRQYDEIFFFHMSNIIIPIVYSCAYNNNENVIINMWEEGAAAIWIYGSQKKWINCLFDLFGIIDPIREKRSMIYWTSRLEYGESTTDGFVCFKGIPRLNRNDSEFITAVNRIFDYIPEPLSNVKVVILEQECGDGKEFEPQNSDLLLFDMVNNIVGRDKVVIKPHPRSDTKRFGDKFQMVSNNKYPLELFLLNQNMEGVCFITISSSSVFMPKYFFGDEPTIIIINDLVSYSIEKKRYIVDEGMPSFYETISEIMMLYSDNNKIICPHSIESFKDILKNIQISV